MKSMYYIRKYKFCGIKNKFYLIYKKILNLVYYINLFFLIFFFIFFLVFFIIFFLVFFISFFYIMNINFISVGWESLNIKNNLFELPLNDFNSGLQNHLFIENRINFFDSSYWFSDHINNKKILNSKLWFSNYNSNKGSFIHYVLNNHGDYLVGNSTLNLRKYDLIRLGDSFVSINSAELKDLVLNSEECSKKNISSFSKFGNYYRYLEMRDMLSIYSNKI